MPSSKDRQRVEIPTSLYERLKLIAENEERTLTSVLQELLQLGFANYQPIWAQRHFMSRFTAHAKHALELAKEEARQLNHNYIGTEHLLLGLSRESDGVAAHVLRQLWIETDKVRAALVYIITSHGNKQPAVDSTSETNASMTPVEAKTGTPASAEAESSPAEEGAESTPLDVDLTARSRKVLALAVDEAQRLHHDYVGTEHLLLALVREGEGLAAGILQTFGVLGKVREFTLAGMQRREAQSVEIAVV